MKAVNAGKTLETLTREKFDKHCEAIWQDLQERLNNPGHQRVLGMCERWGTSFGTGWQTEDGPAFLTYTLEFGELPEDEEGEE